MHNNINHLVIIGAGAMGNGITQVAAMAGYHVTMIDVSPVQLDKGLAAVKRSLGKFQEKGR
ncbi:MAG: 3-hydroxyacyl-CoA dehydrogenase NAD-binding domain-containing protein, partial [Anaerolineales bacterium]